MQALRRTLSLCQKFYRSISWHLLAFSKHSEFKFIILIVTIKLSKKQFESGYMKKNQSLIIRIHKIQNLDWFLSLFFTLYTWMMMWIGKFLFLLWKFYWKVYNFTSQKVRNYVSSHFYRIRLDQHVNTISILTLFSWCGLFLLIMHLIFMANCVSVFPS